MAEKIIPVKSSACQCGAVIYFKTMPRKYCQQCIAIRKAEQSRLGMERQRRKRGVQPVKGVVCECITCRQSFVKSERKNVRCKTCAQHHMIHLTVLQNAVRGRRIRQATPAWADLDAIQNFYRVAKIMESMTGEKWHVDHYYPLRGKLVCGLHVPENLRVIQASINLAKYNAHPV